MSSANINRACESCRSLKVRCRPALEGTGICQRCMASGQECRYRETRRTKRKRTDARVTDLEQQVATLSKLLGDTRSPADLCETYREGPVHRGSHAYGSAPPPPANHTDSDSAHLMSWAAVPLTGYDPVGAGIVSMQEATQLFQRYISELAPQRPLVVFPQGTSAETVRTKSPVVFLAVLAASASTLHGDLGTRLSDIVHRAYADHIMVHGEKSLELVQAILITTSWCHRPDMYDQLRFCQFMATAATMALDIGLGEPPMQATKGISNEELINPDGLIHERTILSCYICCSR